MALYRDLRDDERELIRSYVTRASDALSGRALSFATLQTLYDDLLADAEPATDDVMVVGYAFGELLATAPDLDWAWMMDDEYGDEPAVVVIGKSLGCTPLSMIRARIEDREAWDLAELAEATVQTLRMHASEAGNA